MKHGLLSVIVGVGAFFGLLACESPYSNEKIPEKLKNEDKSNKASLAYLEKITADYPANADGFYKKSLVLTKLKKFTAAEKEVKRAITLDSLQPNYYVQLAKIFYSTQDFEEASEQAQKALAIAKRKEVIPSGVYPLLSDIFYSSNQLSEAQVYINKAIDLAPYSAENFVKQGRIFLAEGDSIKAKKSFVESILKGSNDAGSFSFLTDLYLNEKKVDSALFFLKIQQKYETESLDPSYQQALILRELGAIDSAKSVAKGILLKDSSYFKAYNFLGEIFFKRSQFDSVFWYADRVINFDSNSQKAWLLKARTFDEKRRYSEAVYAYEKLISLNPKDELAKSELRKVKRKIAYLRRMREEKEKKEATPVLQPLKMNKIDLQ
ncbi:tetratricopeptide repeat protein [Xanthovirga aplysinae]|uniref:tetratricopeptide repeat protein n=1 Tax=Xanthovirga aplysinae TaxID=2529853 RepID=UPI0012BB51F7|nr:hypothetical protein [Xanthovirga aplysinae]MTI32777.1 hypothetical protein [Xanthovirga aplysinae]